MWFIGVEAEQETSAPPPKKNPGSAPVLNTSAVYLHSAAAAQRPYNVRYLLNNLANHTIPHIAFIT